VPDANGRFTPGNPGGPGRPARAIELAYLRAVPGTVSLDDWKEVIRKALEQAKAGDSRARDWLSRHLVGEDPVTVVQILDELEQIEQQLAQRNARKGGRT